MSSLSCPGGSTGHVPPLASRSLGSSVRSDGLDYVDLDIGVEGSEERLGIGVDIQTSLTNVQSRDLRDVVILPLTLLLLELEGDTANGPALDTLHQVSGEAGDLVTQALGRDDGDLIGETLVGVEVERQARVVLLDEDARGALNGLGAYATLRRHGV